VAPGFAPTTGWPQETPAGAHGGQTQQHAAGAQAVETHVAARGEPWPQPAAGRQTTWHRAPPGPSRPTVGAGPQAVGAQAAARGATPQHATARLVVTGAHVAGAHALPQAADAGLQEIGAQAGAALALPQAIG
jgi:hypothetical protein